MKYINSLTNVILETDSHLEGGDWVLLEETKQEQSQEEISEEQPIEEKAEKPNKKGAKKTK